MILEYHLKTLSEDINEKLMMHILLAYLEITF